MSTLPDTGTVVAGSTGVAPEAGAAESRLRRRRFWPCGEVGTEGGGGRTEAPGVVDPVGPQRLGASDKDSVGVRES